MKGKEVIQSIGKFIPDSAVNAEGTFHATMVAHIKLMEIHSRALAAHCKCLGMNAENCCAASLNYTPPYNDDHYLTVMKKWGLINEKGEPMI